MGWFEELELRLLDFGFADSEHHFAERHQQATEKFHALTHEMEREMDDPENAFERAWVVEQYATRLKAIVDGLYRYADTSGKGPMKNNRACVEFTDQHGLWHHGYVEWCKAADELGFTGRKWPKTTFMRHRTAHFADPHEVARDSTH